MKYSELRGLIEHYEAWQRRKLRVKLPGHFPNPDLCNGQIQFASIENATKHSGDEHIAPIVVGIGVNYSQKFERKAPHSPWLPDQPSGLPGVEDHDAKMRAVLNETFDAYESNPKLWVDRHLAPEALRQIPPDRKNAPRRNFFLVATNFSPFVTFQEWQQYDSADRAHVLAALTGQLQHLDDLLAILGKEVLWVGHGLGAEAFALFRLWQERNSITQWLLTANLSRGGNIRAVAGKTRFWNRPRPVVPYLTKEDVIGDAYDG